MPYFADTLITCRGNHGFLLAYMYLSNVILQVTITPPLPPRYPPPNPFNGVAGFCTLPRQPAVKTMVCIYYITCLCETAIAGLAEAVRLLQLRLDQFFSQDLK